MPQSTSTFQDLLPAAHAALERIYKPGYLFYRCGLMLDQLTRDDVVQPVLFGMEPDQRHEQLEIVVKAINHRFGKDTIRFAATPLA